jgi:argininosuccinate synthase
MNDTVILAYSGGLDTSALVPWLKENKGLDVVACLVEVGRMKDVDMLMKRALAAGAVDAVAIGAKEESAAQCILPALVANALDEEKYPLVSSLSRPLIAKKLVEKAHEYGAGRVAHGCTAKGNDQVRTERGVDLFDLPAADLRALSPAFDETFRALCDRLASLRAKRSAGGSAPERVLEQLARARELLEQGSPIG